MNGHPARTGRRVTHAGRSPGFPNELADIETASRNRPRRVPFPRPQAAWGATRQAQWEPVGGEPTRDSDYSCGYSPRLASVKWRMPTGKRSVHASHSEETTLAFPFHLGRCKAGARTRGVCERTTGNVAGEGAQPQSLHKIFCALGQFRGGGVRRTERPQRVLTAARGMHPSDPSSICVHGFCSVGSKA